MISQIFVASTWCKLDVTIEKIFVYQGKQYHTETDTPSLTNTDTDTAAPTAFTSLNLNDASTN